MTQTYRLVSLNFGMPRLTFDYTQQGSLSKKDEHIKRNLQTFLKTENWILDPSQPTLIRKDVFHLTSKEIDVILGVCSMLRSCRKIVKGTPQRFMIEHLCAITFTKNRRGPIFIHSEDRSKKGCEKRGLSSRFCIKIENKRVSVARESHQITTAETSLKSFVSAGKVAFVYKNTKKNPGYVVRCVLETFDETLSLQEIIQWRARFKALTPQSESRIITLVAQYLQFVGVLGRSAGAFSTKDLRVNYKEALCKPKKLFSPNNLSSLLFKTKFLTGIKAEDLPKARFDEMSSLLSLTFSMIVKSPNFIHLSKFEKELVSQFFNWGNELCHEIKTTLFSHDTKELPSNTLLKIKLFLMMLSELDQWEGDFPSFCKEFISFTTLLEQNDPELTTLLERGSF